MEKPNVDTTRVGVSRCSFLPSPPRVITFTEPLRNNENRCITCSKYRTCTLIVKLDNSNQVQSDLN